MMDPLLKYPGNKRRLAGALAVKLGPIPSSGRYIEPFAGSAAILFHLEPRSAIVADACQPLMHFYEVVRSMPDAFYQEIQKLLEMPFSPESYYQVRAEWNAKEVSPKFAAQLMYMNKLGFNGLFRLNKTYNYNVAWGKKKKMPKFPTHAEILRASDTLKRAQLYACDYSEIVAMAGENDVLYVDSPYYGTYDRYTGQGFDSGAQVELASQLRLAVDRGARLVASNIDCPEVRDMYSWASIETIQLYHKIGCTTGSRKIVNEAIIVGDRRAA